MYKPFSRWSHASTYQLISRCQRLLPTIFVTQPSSWVRSFSTSNYFIQYGLVDPVPLNLTTILEPHILTHHRHLLHRDTSNWKASCRLFFFGSRPTMTKSTTWSNRPITLHYSQLCARLHPYLFQDYTVFLVFLSLSKQRNWSLLRNYGMHIWIIWEDLMISIKR